MPGLRLDSTAWALASAYVARRCPRQGRRGAGAQVSGIGFAACSLQPNAGSQGEYSGLLVIRAYHKERGE